MLVLHPCSFFLMQSLLEIENLFLCNLAASRATAPIAGSGMLEFKNFATEAMDSTGAVSVRHMRSMSDSDKIIKKDQLDASVKSFRNLRMAKEEDNQAQMNRRPSPNYEVESSLRKEIQQLEKCLKDQFFVRRALEKALRHKNSSIDSAVDSYIPNSTKKLIREIAMLELEVVHLEQYLLSLYRGAFEQQIPNVSPTSLESAINQPLIPQSAPFPAAASHDISFRKVEPAVHSTHHSIPPRMSANNLHSQVSSVAGPEKQIHRSLSSLAPNSICSDKNSISAKHVSRALKHEESFKSGATSLADHLGATIADHIPETPNRLSEDMVRSMCTIFCRLRDYHIGHHGAASSPTSSFSSRNTFSPCYTREFQSPCYKWDAVLDAWFENSLCTDRLKEFSRPYSVMVEVSSLCKASRGCSDVEEMLHNYKLLVQRLEIVDPRKMSNNEKIAFWVNVHNAMMMHAHLEYGIPRSSKKRASFLTKNTYNVGGRMVDAECIQNSILGCRMNSPGQWLRVLLSSKVKIKDGDEWKSYAIKNPEPLIRFALCAGSHSDPAVRIYSSKRLFQLLKVVKMDYIHSTVTIRKGQRILLPKIVAAYARDSNLSTQELMDMIECYLPESLRLMTNAFRESSNSRRVIEWVPYNFTFRYLLPRDLGNLKLN